MPATGPPRRSRPRPSPRARTRSPTALVRQGRSTSTPTCAARSTAASPPRSPRDRCDRGDRGPGAALRRQDRRRRSSTPPRAAARSRAGEALRQPCPTSWRSTIHTARSRPSTAGGPVAVTAAVARKGLGIKGSVLGLQLAGSRRAGSRSATISTAAGRRPCAGGDASPWAGPALDVGHRLGAPLTLPRPVTPAVYGRPGRRDAAARGGAEASCCRSGSTASGSMCWPGRPAAPSRSP